MSAKVMNNGDLHIVRAGNINMHIIMHPNRVMISAYDSSGRQHHFSLRDGAVITTSGMRISENGATVTINEGKTQVALRTLVRVFGMALNVGRAKSFVEQVAGVARIHDFIADYIVYPPSSEWLLGQGEE